MLEKINISHFNSHQKEKVDLLILMPSFEERSLVVCNALKLEQIDRVLALCNDPINPIARGRYENLLKRFGNALIHTDVRIGQPVFTADALISEVIPLIEKAIRTVLIDITTFTHEHLAMLVYHLIDYKLMGKIKFAYTGADKYSFNTAPQDIWLSRGVKQVRSVLGFPGELVPSRDLHLILMVGFELERAQGVIDAFEPAKLSIGFAPEAKSVTKELSATNQEFFRRLRKFLNETSINQFEISEFEFSSVDPDETRKALLREVDSSNTFNTVICPLNTKLSTIGACLAATEREDIQLCYAEPMEYNTQGYSTPGNQITLFSFEAP